LHEGRAVGEEEEENGKRRDRNKSKKNADGMVGLMEFCLSGCIIYHCWGVYL